MKRPAFQFYPADWRSNAKLRRCSESARGAWMDVLCLLHDSDEYGVSRWPLADIARAAGVPLKLLKELAEKGVLKGCDKQLEEAFIYTPRSGRKDGEPVTLIPAQAGAIWFCSRMVRDEHIRKHAGASTRFGSRQDEKPDTPPGDFHTPSRAPSRRQGDGSSSSSSSSSKDSTPLPPIDDPEAKPLCTIEQALSKAPEYRMSTRAVHFWWHTRNSAGWRKGGAGNPLIRSWQSDMAASVDWAEDGASKRKNGGNGSASKASL